MADDTIKRITRTATGSNVHENQELRYWDKRARKLRQTVEKVGVMATDVRKALGNSRTWLSRREKDHPDQHGLWRGSLPCAMTEPYRVHGQPPRLDAGARHPAGSTAGRAGEPALALGVKDRTERPASRDLWR